MLGGRSLRREATAIADQLSADDLAAARVQVRNLVGRETSELGADEIARATVESVAENTSDAVVAPLLWGAVAGVPGPARLPGGEHPGRHGRTPLAALRAVRLGGGPAGRPGQLGAGPGGGAGRLRWPRRWSVVRPAVALRTVRRDAGQHPSPNAGVVEAAFAGALGIRLGGRNVYAGRVEERGVLGDGRAVAVGDIARANRLARAVSIVALVVSCALSLSQGRPHAEP